MSDSLQLVVRSDQATATELDTLTRDLTQHLARNAPSVRTTLPKPGTPGPGQKGAEIAVGTIIIALINAGAIKALVDCLSAWITQRKRAVKFDVKNAAGETLTLDAQNLKPKDVEKLVDQLRDFAGKDAPREARA